jgi:hypothetical protein
MMGLPAEALDYPWGILIPENDSRDQEMRAYDEADSVNMISVINESEKPFHHHLFGVKVPIKNLLSAKTAFCEMHFAAVRPLVLTPDEKAILQEYLKRGGFILFFIDTYPYAQDEFWKVKDWPLIDFVRQELPGADPRFTAGRATDDFSIFGIHYKTQTAIPTRPIAPCFFTRDGCAALSWENMDIWMATPGCPDRGRSRTTSAWTPKAIG